MWEAHHLLLIALLISFGSCSMGFMGLGFGIILLGGAAFTTMDLERLSVVGNLLQVVISGSILVAGWKESRVHWGVAGMMTAGQALGVPLGYWFIFAFGHTGFFRFLLGLTLFCFAANEFLRPAIRKRLHPGFAFGAGVFGGFCTGSFFAGGPIYALYLYSRVDQPREAKGTLQVVFLAATLWRLFSVVFFGKGITAEVTAMAGLAFPLVAAFSVLGHVLSRRFSTVAFRRVTYSFVGLVGVLNMWGFKA